MKLAATAVLCYKIRNDKSVVHLAVSNQERKVLAVTESEDKPKLTRKQARELGEKHYYSENPCKRGHEPKRFAISNDCVQCLFERDRKRYGPLKRGVIKSTREIALEAGLKQYFTGKPCHRGHIDSRIISSYECMACAREDRKNEYWENVQESRKKCDEYRSKNRAELNLRAQKWKKKNREKILKQQRERYWRDPELARKASKAWRIKNPEKAKVTIHNSQAKRKKAEGRHTAKQIRELLRLQKYRCANCKCCIKNYNHIDHIMPLSKGGSNDIKNIQMLCGLCNLRKHAKDPIVWAREQGRLL